MDTPTKLALIPQLENSWQRTTDWIRSQPEDHFNRELVPGKWTIAGHLYHLIKTTKAVTKGLKMPKLALRTMFGKNNRQERTHEQLHQKYLQALSTATVQAPVAYAAEPGRVFDREELLQRFASELTDFLAALDRWNEKEMGTYIMPHPAIGKCTLREFVYFSIFHTEHHLAILERDYQRTP